ncbi:hypothetical protein HJG54_06695 [Leptolyngbya sp. NK1-12]|uniref:Uncharacterized protein n=1 Tax=Leptolyngbya sp. NK1-12 TaxID=2547451 RepID=A0AA97AJA5_9CYAN|nr:hypothetical protein [Leptolyngbya sp. NK1-12]WNZ22577.1 hypothetical protein HJG54_06695 [Leptolyngbya sp. NK1-12]
MKTGLKRIEATLGQLNAQTPPQGYLESDPLEQGELADRSRSFLVSDADPVQSTSAKKAKTTIQPFPFPQEPQLPVESRSVEPRVKNAGPMPAAKPKPAHSSSKSSGNRSGSNRAGGNKSDHGNKPNGNKSGAKAKKVAVPHPVAETVQPFPAEQNCPDTPALPKPKPPSFSSHRHAVNPNLALGLIKEVETVVMRWQLDLEQTVLEIQALYLEGPIVEGWLESHAYDLPPVTPAPGMATLRHAEPDQLLEYIEEICRTPQTLDLEEAPRTGYRLCGLDADGQLWSRPCPPQQVPYVSLAIARYQKLRILFAKKQNLESRLNQLVQNLTLLHGQMQEQA